MKKLYRFFSLSLIIFIGFSSVGLAQEQENQEDQQKQQQQTANFQAQEQQQQAELSGGAATSVPNQNVISTNARQVVATPSHQNQKPAHSEDKKDGK